MVRVVVLQMSEIQVVRPLHSLMYLEIVEGAFFVIMSEYPKFGNFLKN